MLISRYFFWLGVLVENEEEIQISNKDSCEVINVSAGGESTLKYLSEFIAGLLVGILSCS